MTKLEKVWIAGFYEGEGYFGVSDKTCYSKTGKKYVYKDAVLRGSISQKYRPIIQWIRNKLGFGTVRFMQNRKSSFGSSIWSLAFTHSHALRFAQLIRPYMRTPHKKKQMDTAIKLWSK